MFRSSGTHQCNSKNSNVSRVFNRNNNICIWMSMYIYNTCVCNTEIVYLWSFLHFINTGIILILRGFNNYIDIAQGNYLNLRHFIGMYRSEIMLCYFWTIMGNKGSLSENQYPWYTILMRWLIYSAKVNLPCKNVVYFADSTLDRPTSLLRVSEVPISSDIWLRRWHSND